MKPEIVIQSGHVLRIGSIGFSPDGTLAATASPDETVRLWDLRAGLELRALVGHEGPVYSVCFSRDGRFLATASYDKTVRVWEIESGSTRHVLRGFRFPVNDVYAAGDLVAGATMSYRGDTQVRLFRWLDAELVAAWDLEVDDRSGWEAAISPDGARLATYGESAGQILVREVGGSAPPRPLAVRKLESEEPTIHPAMRFLGDSVTLVLAGGDNPPQILSLDGREARSLPSERRILRLELLDDGLLAAYAADAIELWECASGTLVDTLRMSARAIAPKRKLAADADARNLVIRDVASNREILRLGSRLELPDFIGNMARCFPLATNPVYPMVASAAPDGWVRLWDLRGGQGPHIFKVSKSLVEALAFDPWGTKLATGGEAVRVWDAWTRELIAEYEIPGVRNLAFAPDRYLAAATKNEVTLIDLERGEQRPVELDAQGPELNDVLFNRFGGRFLVGGFKGFHEFSVEPLERLGGNEIGYVSSLAESPDGTLGVVLSASKWIHGQLMTYSKEPQKPPRSAILMMRRDSKELRHFETRSKFVTDAAFSADGRWLAMGSAEGDLNLWDLSGGPEPQIWSAHAGGVTALGWLSDSRFLATAGMDSAVHLWRPGERRPAATMVSTSDSDFVIVTDSGSYTATRGGVRGVAFRTGNRAVSFDQFDLTLNRPDQVHAALGYAYHDLIDSYHDAHRRRRRRLGFGDEDQDDLEAPSVEILSEPPDLSTSERHLAVRLRATSAAHPLRRLRVLVNDVAERGRQSLELEEDAATVERTVEIELSAGMNRIEVSALSSSGAESPRQTLITAYTGAADPPTLWVVAIGVSDYGHETLDLKYAAKDARDIARVLTGQKAHFGAAETLVLTDQQANRQAIVDSRRFLERAGIDDQVVLFFAGHGVLSGGDYYFLPSDFAAGPLERHAVHYDEIEGLLDGLTARRRLVLLDTCHAGEADYVAPAAAARRPPEAVRVRSFRHVDFAAHPEIGRGHRLATDRVLGELFSDLRRGAGAFVIAASGASEYAIEREQLGNGVFTHCVLEALVGGAADRNEDGAVVVSELHRYVSARVVELTGGHQQPISRRENLTHDFPVF